MHSSVLFLTFSSFIPNEEELIQSMSPERKKFLGLHPTYQWVDMLGLKSGEKAWPLSCSCGLSVLRLIVLCVLRLHGAGQGGGEEGTGVCVTNQTCH